MSRIGKKPVAIPSGVTATVSGQKVTLKGPKGELSFTCPDEIKVAIDTVMRGERYLCTGAEASLTPAPTSMSYARFSPKTLK